CRTIMLPRLALTRGERGAWLRPRVIAQLLRGRYDAIIFEASLALTPEIAAALASRPVTRSAVLLWGSGWQPAEPSVVTRVRTLMHRAMVRSADAAIAYSDTAAAWFRDRGAREVFVAPNATDAAALQELREAAAHAPQRLVEARRTRGVTRPYVLHVGTLRAEKRIDVLLDAWERLRDRRGHELVIVGGGAQLRELQERARHLADVRWLGPVYEPFELLALFAGARCFVLPGTGGLAINEALSVGTPVIVASADGTERALVADGVNGLFVAPGDVESLASALQRLLDDDALRARLGANARTRIDTAINMGAMQDGFLRAVSRCVE
ncbi:MAG TPA: glycosyltransferase family 4 protein, partial [Kofleriaceae bacterium]|nr:glycosyltransferase family 4 protein [Kofleriaceae bacterium]